MKKWMEGYESDVEYISGYYREQEPDFLNLCALSQGIEPQDLSGNFTYCELGCGMGLTTLIMAANYPQGMFYAVDFNPSHIAQARNIAKQAGLANVVFLEKSFAQLVENPELLPECDFIALHGIFTWVSDENRQHLVTLCHRHLKAGGMVYNSYNAKPGWSISEPIQKLLFTASKQFRGNSLERFDKALDLVKQLDSVNPRFFALSSNVIKKRLDSFEVKNRHYLVHEYLHEGWRAFYFSEVADVMNTAKLEFMGAASLTASHARTLLPNKVKALLKEVGDRNTQELFLDVYLNSSFRSDIYTRGVNGYLDEKTKLRRFESTRWMLAKPAQLDDAALEFTLSTGKYTLKKAVYMHLIERLAENGVVGFRDLVNGLSSQEDAIRALMLMYNAHMIAPHYASTDTQPARRLNQVLLAQQGYQIALPYTRSQMRLKLFDAQFYYAALVLGTTDAKQLVSFVYEQFQRDNMAITHEGKTLRGDAMQAHLVKLEAKWRENILPILSCGGALDLALFSRSESQVLPTEQSSTVSASQEVELAL